MLALDDVASVTHAAAPALSPGGAWPFGLPGQTGTPEYAAGVCVALLVLARVMPRVEFGL
jgi:hypothetical protein